MPKCRRCYSCTEVTSDIRNRSHEAADIKKAQSFRGKKTGRYVRLSRTALGGDQCRRLVQPVGGTSITERPCINSSYATDSHNASAKLSTHDVVIILSAALSDVRNAFKLLILL